MLLLFRPDPRPLSMPGQDALTIKIGLFNWGTEKPIVKNREAVYPVCWQVIMSAAGIYARNALSFLQKLG